MGRKTHLNAPGRLKVSRVMKRHPMLPRGKKVPKKGTDTPKLWSLKKADDLFSLYVRNRDGRCMHPVGCPVSDIKKLQCSHYVGRAHKATRYDPHNCVALCWFHHYKSKEYGLEYHKQTKEKHKFDGWYTIFMRDHIGEHEFIALQQRGIEDMKVKRAIENCMQFLKK